jgi:hypothetical protein
MVIMDSQLPEQPSSSDGGKEKEAWSSLAPYLTQGFVFIMGWAGRDRP